MPSFRYRTNRNGSVTVTASKSKALPDGCRQTINYAPGNVAINMRRARWFAESVERKIAADKAAERKA